MTRFTMALVFLGMAVACPSYSFGELPESAGAHQKDTTKAEQTERGQLDDAPKAVKKDAIPLIGTGKVIAEKDQDPKDLPQGPQHIALTLHYKGYDAKAARQKIVGKAVHFIEIDGQLVSVLLSSFNPKTKESERGSFNPLTRNFEMKLYGKALILGKPVDIELESIDASIDPHGANLLGKWRVKIIGEKTRSYRIELK